ncbi:hypothetical protein GPECTOR_1g274 [Gonium pectorale]|uniref:Cullin family profile domain-containing protein n=1 Tax=Gonium pectorale TaxID=33097 RepID=A0A150H2K9_GONPE|nr:hypothetical protein GPECTOR_1g274 [Gonium pectorale]|eukprot:KXZ56311.1 hypothetical protein GPECTOR_1g274 [Gonium pectorale]
MKKGMIKIEPFRHPISIDPHYAEKTWKVLEDAIREIHNQNASGLSFEELYRNAYNMVLHKYGPRLYDGLINTLTAHLTDIASKIEGKEGAPFLKELKKRWDEHNKSTQMIRDILMYMDRTFVVQQQKTPVFALGLELWRDQVVRNRQIQERLLTILMQLILKERQGEMIERGLIKSVTQMLVDLGHAVYVEDFEKHFLAAAAEFYKKEAQDFISSTDCPEYLRRAEQRLGEEQERCSAYLDASTEPKITRVVENELLKSQMTALLEMENSGLIALLRDDKYEDLARLYGLMRRVDNGLATVRNMLCEHVKEVGRALVTDPERTKDPVEYVQALLDMRDKYEKIVTQAFSDDKTFRNALNQAFEHFLNLNPRSPEFISLFIDDKLRRGIKGLSDSDVEGVLDKVMALFRYLQEKDVFEKYYKGHLAKRLLSGRTTSDDAERNLLVKLKTECGYQFTSKLESMFTDIKTSRDTMADFRTKLVESGKLDELGGIDLQVQAACEAFRAFYLSTHSGRRLTFQPNMGTADLRAVFGAGRRHELNVSTYQMCILLLFNEQDSMSYRDIAQATEIPTPDLKRALQSLACVKGRNVLRKEPASKDVADTDVFYFNDKFTSKLIKVKISTVAATKEGESEKAETRQKVEEDRKPQIEAAIVRIMKARQRLDHNTIITEVTRQLAARFVPNPATIKKRIESLIEREFLARDENDRKFYTYVA